MAAVLAEAMDAGALGFSTSRSFLHTVPDGTPLPGTFARPGGTGRPSPPSSAPRPGRDRGRAADRRARRRGAGELGGRAGLDGGREPVVRPAADVRHHPERPPSGPVVLGDGAGRRGQGRGAPTCGRRPRPAARRSCTAWSSRTPYDTLPGWAELMAKPWPARVEALADDALRRRLAEQAERRRRQSGPAGAEGSGQALPAAARRGPLRRAAGEQPGRRGGAPGHHPGGRLRRVHGRDGRPGPAVLPRAQLRPRRGRARCWPIPTSSSAWGTPARTWR